MSDAEIIEIARTFWRHTQVEVDPDAEISRAEGGVWVQGWIWVPDDASE